MKRTLIFAITFWIGWAGSLYAHEWMDAIVGPTPDSPRYDTPHYDVDTLYLTIDLGFMGQRWYGPVRIYCIDGAEIRPLKTREIATEQRDFGASLAPGGTRVKVRHYGRGKYGRPVLEMLIGGLNYGPTVFAEFPDSMELEAYGDEMIAECRAHLGVSE